jgi:hypothetical protein
MRVSEPSIYVDTVATVEARHQPADPDARHGHPTLVHVDVRDGGAWGQVVLSVFGPPELLELLGRALVEAVTTRPEIPGSPVIITPKLEDLDPAAAED